MSTTQTVKNVPCKGLGENAHSRTRNSPIYSCKHRSPTHRPHTEAYEYNSMSNTMPPAGEYIRAPVCCSECEDFWKALILEIDEKHTSKVPAGKASLIMAKGTSGSVLQIRSTKHVTKDRRFFPGLGCINSAVRGDALSCQPRAYAGRQISSNSTLIKSGRRHESPQKKLNISTMRSNHVVPPHGTPWYGEPFVNQSSLPPMSKKFDLQGNLHRSAVGYNTYGAAPKYDVISTPRRHSHIPHRDSPKSPHHPEPPGTTTPSFTQNRSNHLSSMSSEASEVHLKGDRQHAHPDAFKPIRTRLEDSRPEDYTDLSTPRRYTPIWNENMASHGLHHPSYADSNQLKPFPPPTSSFYGKSNSREFLSHPTTPRMNSSLQGSERSMPQTPRASALHEKHVEDYLHYNCPPMTAESLGSRGRWYTDNQKEHYNSSTGGIASHRLREPNNIYDVDRASSKHSPPSRENFLSSAPSSNKSSQNANPSAGRSSSQDIPSERELSRTSTAESGYTSFSMPASDSSASTSNSQELDQDSPILSPRSSIAQARAKGLQPKDLPRNGMGNTPPPGGLSLKIPNRVNNLSRTSTSTSSLMEPIVLFTGHGCRSETDENSEDDDSDIAVTNPNYFKHIFTNPNYLKHIIKPQPVLNSVNT